MQEIPPTQIGSWIVSPVDFVADVLAHVRNQPVDGLQVLHLCHSKPRTWREFVVWMNLYGCRIELMPTARWLSTAFESRERIGRRLYAYRKFFQVANTGYRPFESYLKNSQRKVTTVSSQRAIARMGVSLPDLSGDLVYRYLAYYQSVGLLKSSQPKPNCNIPCGPDFVALLNPQLGLGSELLSAREVVFVNANGVLNEVSAAHLGSMVGMRRFEVTLRDATNRPRTLDTVIKSKAPGPVMESLTVQIATQCDAALGKLLNQNRSALELGNSHERELAIYEMKEARLQSFIPACYGTHRSVPTGINTIALEFLADPGAELPNDPESHWNQATLESIVDGLATIQSVSYPAMKQLIDSGVLLPNRPTHLMNRMAGLWIQLARYAHKTSRIGALSCRSCTIS